MNDAIRINKACPVCEEPLTIRTNGVNGEYFLSCSGYPRCHHTEPLPRYLLKRVAGDSPLPGFE